MLLSHFLLHTPCIQQILCYANYICVIIAQLPTLPLHFNFLLSTVSNWTGCDMQASGNWSSGLRSNPSPVWFKYFDLPPQSQCQIEMVFYKQTTWTCSFRTSPIKPQIIHCKCYFCINIMKTGIPGLLIQIWPQKYTMTLVIIDCHASTTLDQLQTLHEGVAGLQFPAIVQWKIQHILMNDLLWINTSSFKSYNQQYHKKMVATHLKAKNSLHLPRPSESSQRGKSWSEPCSVAVFKTASITAH